ncbi:MAG: ATP-binding protein, partial [Pseudomonadota bacterium]
RRQAEEAAHREASISEALAELSNVIISSPPIEDLSFAVLQQARRLTGSRFGYAGYIDPETGNLVSPTLTREIWDMCEVQDKDIVFREFRGLWGWVLNNKEPLFTNRSREDQRSSGTPQGHIPIERFLSVPALFEEKLVGQIALANPDGDYTEQDVVLAGRLAALYAIGIRRKRDEEALSALALDLEQRVEIRTAELTQAIKQLGQEIEDRKEAEKKLKTSEKRMRRLVESSPVGIFINRGGKYVYINPAFLKMFGYEHLDEIVGRPVESLVAPEDRELVMKSQRERREGKKVSLSYEIRGLKKDGKGFDMVLWASVIDYDGKPAILGFVVDMSLEKELRSQLLQSQKMEALGTLAGGIAHDFNNILAAIIGYAELAKMKASKERALIHDLDEVIKAGKRAKNLVRQILTVSRQTEEERKPTAPIYIVNEALKLLRASVPTSIKFDQRIEKDTGTILADPTRIHQVLMNLCTNAQHAMREEGGVLGVSLGNAEVDSRTAQYMGIDPGAYVKLTVSDNGHGITPEVKERVFEPYFTTKEKGEGTGLGLSVVHEIIESYGGKILVYSEPGKGSTFHVYFPRIDTVSKEAGEPEEAALLPTGTERILFVDDEETLVKIGKQMLEQLGYEVAALTDSVEAIKRFSEDPDKFDLVITDLSMPDVTGERLAQEVMNIRPGIPVMMCSGFDERIRREKAKKMGVKAFIQKPLTFEELAKAVREALDD